MASSKHKWQRRPALWAGLLLYPALLHAQISVPRTRTADALLRQADETMQRAAALQRAKTKSELALSGSLFTQSGQLFEAAHSREKAASAYLEAAEIHVTFSKYDQARSLYRTASRLGSDEERCRALSRLARTYATTGPRNLADRYSADALNFCEPLKGKAEAEGLEARGEALVFAGELTKSVGYLERAEQLFAAAHDDRARAQSQLMLAFALFSDGKQQEGFQAAGRALQLWLATEDYYGVARARAALGIFAITRGEFETAQCNYRIAESVLRDFGNKDERASVLNGLGYASRETGDTEKSLEYYQRARALFASVQDLLGEHEAITGMGKALLGMKRYKAVLPLYAAGLRAARRSGEPALIASSLGDMAALYEAEGQYGKSETFYRRALETYRQANHLYGEGDILIRLGRLQARVGNYPQALTTLEQANLLKEKTGQIEEVAKIQFEVARIYARLNHLDEAKSAVEKTIGIVEAQRVTISQFDSRASYFSSVHRYYALYIELLMRLSERDPGLDFVKSAFEASERSKVRSLLDLLSTSAQDASCDELLDKQLRAGVTAGVQVVPTSLKEGRAGPTLALGGVQAQIEDGTVLLEYALGDDKSYAWVVNQNQIAWYPLPGADQLRKLVDTMRETLMPPEPREEESASDYQVRARKIDRVYELSARQLSRLLLGSVDLAGARRVLIVPDGSLQYVPFAALPLNGSGRSRQLLIDKYEVGVLPSASVLGTLRAASANRAPPTAGIAVFADPVFERDDPRVKKGLSPHRAQAAQERPPALTRAIRDTGGAQYVPRLPASREEAKTITAIFRAPDPANAFVALDFDASRDRILTDGLAQFRMIHFATHGVVDARHPEMSGLILSLVDAEGRKRDGYLRMGDIYKLRLAADLIVLSSCESALGKDMDSEGIIGLPRAFLYAGAKSVVASSWKVDDQATARMMSVFYKRIKKGEKPSSALRNAQLEMARDERWSKPYYWAAFSVQGDYQ